MGDPISKNKVELLKDTNINLLLHMGVYTTAHLHTHTEPDLVVHVCDPSTGEAEGGRYLELANQPA